MLSSEELRILADLLNNNLSNAAISAERQHELLSKGAVAVLEENAVDDPGVIETLQSVCINQPTLSVRAQALQGLLRHAQAGEILAIDALYNLSIENDLLAARQAILAHQWMTSRQSLRILFNWFTSLESGKPFPENELEILTEAYLSAASKALQQRLLATAAQNHAENWAFIAAAVQNPSASEISRLVERYPSFRPIERDIAIDHLSRLAASGSPDARDGLARLFIQHDETRARDALLSGDNLPDDPEQRALLFFLAGEWERYTALDFDHNLLISAYERSGRLLRRRLLEHSRYTGQMDWLRSQDSSMQGSPGDVRWLVDLTDSDWELIIQRLAGAERPDDLWRLAQVAPPLWSAAILDRLKKQEWAPQNVDEHAGFTLLAELAADCLSNPLTIKPKKALHAPITDITCLAIHPEGKLLAAGSSSQQISLWALPDGILRHPPLQMPAPVIRTLAFSPDGSLLAAAGGDNRIRLFNTQTGQLIKTLDGHRAMIRALAIHPDGRTLYSAGFDGAAYIWRFPHGSNLKILRPGPGEIFSMALGREGSHLLTAGADCLIHVWALPEGALVRELAGHTDTITMLAVSQTSDLVASVGRDGTLRLWNFTSGGLLRVLSTAEPITALCMHPNNQFFISGSSSGKISIWNLSTGLIITQLIAHQNPITGLVLSPNGDRLYSVDSLANLHAWDLQTFLDIRTANENARPAAVNTYQDRLKDIRLSSTERQWIELSAALANWRQRFDIELAEANTIALDEFDIEL